jgi:hypothetical protein
MRAHHLVVMLSLAVSRPAAAVPHKVLVLQSEGRADAATRGKINAAIVKLALASEPQTSAGELTYSDAATAVGCKPETALCRDEVLGMLAVDEIVTTTVTPKPGGLEIAVHRITMGGVSRDATMLLLTGTPPDKLDGIAPLFGAKPAARPAPAAPPAPASPGPAARPSPVSPAAAPPGPTARPAIAASPGPAGPAASAPPAPPGRPTSPALATTERPAGEPPLIPPPTAVKHEPLPPPGTMTPGASPMGTANVPPADEPSTRRHRLEIAGMAGGGGMVVIGLVLWSAASGVQGDIDKAPTRTKQDLIDLKNLESKGDGYAALGNLFTVGGLVIGGIGTYYYIKDRRAASTTTARLTPTVFDHGAGLVFTIGGTP